VKKQIFTLALAGLFGIGIAGAAPWPQDQGDSTQAYRGMRGRQMDPDQAVQRLSKQLNLTDDQKSQIKPILADRQQQMKNLMQDESLQPQDRREKMRSIMADTNSKIKAVLNDDQKAKFDKMQQQMRERMQQRRQEHQQGGESGGNGNQ
jgi:Spy/CpxP family protein refolding chaperone